MEMLSTQWAGTEQDLAQKWAETEKLTRALVSVMRDELARPYDAATAVQDQDRLRRTGAALEACTRALQSMDAAAEAMIRNRQRDLGIPEQTTALAGPRPRSDADALVATYEQQLGYRDQDAGPIPIVDTQ